MFALLKGVLSVLVSLANNGLLPILTLGPLYYPSFYESLLTNGVAISTLTCFLCTIVWTFFSEVGY